MDFRIDLPKDILLNVVSVIHTEKLDYKQVAFRRKMSF